ncbi:hypothetical protein [Frisingicoccus sp.]|uniref:hypothetical protein n=1 Tax=Frisingicoccus sp. TaxID=1918627 RepID=UPI0038708FA1
MKKSLIMLTLSMMLALTACEGKSAETTTKESVETHTETINETVIETQEEESGEIVDNSEMLKIPVYTRKELNMTGEAGPIKYSIDGIQVSKLTFKSEDMASLAGIDPGKEIACVALDLSGENTSEETINFYLGQATLVSNTKEQVDPNMLFSDYVSGEYLGQVIHSGTSIYLFENSNAEDITNLKLYISAPSDSSFNSLSEDIVIEINLE